MVTASFRSVAAKMDPVVTPRGARGLAAMHRWSTPGGQPPTPLSLRSVLGRHVHPRTVELRLLFYNTFLVAGFKLPVGAIVGTIGGLPGIALGHALDALGWTTIDIGEKPARERRSSEIGQALAAGAYDIAALCEVFNPEDRNRILAGFNDGRRVVHVEGPGERNPGASSGLLTAVAGWNVAAEQHAFGRRGKEVRDSDAWANKGVLRAAVDLGIGSLEVYSTHLFNGGGMPSLPIVDQDFADGERAGIQNDQLDELVDFFVRTHEPRNVALVVGDFNIDASDQDRQGALMQRMGDLGMTDLWAGRNGGRGYSSDFDGDEQQKREGICPLDRDERYCDDLNFARYTEEAARIDYIFVERPRIEHAVAVDLTRPRRVPFKRPAETEGMRFMSDHIGFETTLIVTPR